MQDNDAKRLRGLTKSANEKKRHFHTRTMNQIDMQETIDMLGRHLLNFARLSSVWHEFSSRNPDENWRRREKSKGLGGQNTHKKSSPEQLSLYLAYNMPPRLLYRTPPLCHPILALCPPLWRCTLCQDNNPRQQGSDNKNGRRAEVFFSLKPTVIPIFLPITDSR